jgi:hypothetical protein
VKLFSTALLMAFLLASCKKDTPPPAPAIPAQTWTFKSVTYHTFECFADTNTNNFGLHANNGSPADTTGYSALLCNFYGKSFPTANGTYTVALVNTPDSSLTSAQVTISLTLGGLTNVYQSTGGTGTQQVFVTINNGKISVSGSNIELENYNSAISVDSAALSFNITQTQ